MKKIFQSTKKISLLLWWSIHQFYKSSPILFFTSNFFTITTSLFYLVYVKLQGNLIDSFINISSRPEIIIIPLLLFLIFSLFQDVVGYIQNTFIDRILSTKTEKYFTEKFIHHYTTLDIGRIEQSDFQDLKEKVGNRAIWQIRQVPTDISYIVAQIITIIISTGIISFIHPFIAICMILTTIPSFVTDFYHTNATNKLWEDYTKERRIYWYERYVLEAKQSVQELITANKVSKIKQRIFKFMADNYHREASIEKKFLPFKILSIAITTIGVGVAIVFIILKTKNGSLSPGELVFSFGVLYQIRSSIQSIAHQFSSIKEVLPSIEYAKAFFAVKPFIEQPINPKILPAGDPVTIVFDSVSFTYPNQENPVLNNINFTLSPGQKIALVGLNGAGKSTIIKLLLRMYNPTSGKILINNIDLRDIDIISWYNELGILLQNSTRYEFLSIRKVINLFAKKEKTDQEIIHLLQNIHAESIIENEPQGIDIIQSTEYGGKEFSGGQFQKIAIARTLARDAQCIILDEPTSSIDALSEEKIFKTLHELPNTISMLFISHRFTTIRNADYIIVLENGSVIEEGTHKKLLLKDGLYKKMYSAQILGK